MRHLIVVPGLISHVNRCSLALLMRHLAVVLELTLHVNRSSLARATGPSSSNGSFLGVDQAKNGGIFEGAVQAKQTTVL